MSSLYYELNDMIEEEWREKRVGRESKKLEENVREVRQEERKKRGDQSKPELVISQHQSYSSRIWDWFVKKKGPVRDAGND